MIHKITSFCDEHHILACTAALNLLCKLPMGKAYFMAIQKTNNRNEPPFVPKGALAFFVLMLLGFGLIWLGMYWLTLHRQLGL